MRDSIAGIMNSLLVSNITGIYGAHGAAWLAELPVLVERIAQAYRLKELVEVDNMSYNYVIAGRQKGMPIILKLGLDEDGLRREAAALEALTGHGCVKLLASAPGMLLLEQAVPGGSLKSYFPDREEEAVMVACGIMKRLHKAPTPKGNLFPHVEHWLADLDRSYDIPAEYLKQAKSLRDELLATTELSVLLHGDLHHDNILHNGQNWLVIDPKGVMGEPAYEVAAFIRNPIPELLEHSEHKAVIERRIAIFSDALGYKRQRILDWCFVQSVLAWIWAIQDGTEGLDYFKRLTEMLAKLLAE